MSGVNFNDTTKVPATLTGTETLTNKTLTSPAINTGVLTSATITTGLTPTSNDGAALGSTALQFSDLFLAEGGVINFDNGDATLTQVSDVVTLDGADLKITTPGNAATSVLTTNGTQTITGKSMVATQLTGTAFTMAVNNTNGTAAYTLITYQAPGQQTYAGTIVWTGTTAPSSTLVQQYYWRQFDKEVRLTISISYAVVGLANTQVTLTLPSDCPAPVEWAGQGAANDTLYPATATVGSSRSNVGAARATLSVNAADNGYLIVIGMQSVAAQVAMVTVVYQTA